MTSLPSYIRTSGDCTFDIKPGSKYHVAIGEPATLKRVFYGLTSLTAQWISQNPLYICDKQYPWCVLKDYDIVDEDGFMSSISCDYAGLQNNGITPDSVGEKVKWEPKNVVLYTDQSADGAISVNYYAPTITNTYSLQQANDLPSYTAQLQFTNNIAILDTNPPQYDPASSSTLGYKGKLQYTVVAVCTGFERDKQGVVYKYTETNAVLLQSNKTQSLPATGATAATTDVSSEGSSSGTGAVSGGSASSGSGGSGSGSSSSGSGTGSSAPSNPSNNPGSNPGQGSGQNGGGVNQGGGFGLGDLPSANAGLGLVPPSGSPDIGSPFGSSNGSAGGGDSGDGGDDGGDDD